MSIAYRKVWRDLARNKTRTFLVVLSTAIGIFALGLVISLSDLMTERMTGEWQASRPAHVTFWVDSVDEDTVDVMAHTPGVAEIEPVIYGTIQWKHPGDAEWRNGFVTARQDYDHQRQNLVTLASGVWPGQERNSIAVERQSINGFQIPVGSQVVIKASTVERTLKVTGAVRDLTVYPPQFGGDAAFFMSAETLRDLLGVDGYNSLNIRLPEFEKKQASTVGEQVKRRLEKAGHTAGQPQVQDPKRHFIQEQLDPILMLMGMLGVLSLFLSGFLVVNTINSVLAQQTSQIGVMKAVGATPGRVVRVYLVMVLIYGLLSIALAVPLSAVASRALAGMLLVLFNIEMGSFRFVPLAVIVQLAVGLLVPLIAALWPVLTSARITVREAISSYGLGADFGAGLIDRVVVHIRRLPRPLALSLRNTFRRKGRVVLTQITLIIAGIMFMDVMSISSSLMYTLDRVFATYSFDVWLETENLERFERVEAVAASVPGVTASEMAVIRTGTVNLGGDQKRQITFWGILPDSRTLNPNIVAGRWLRMDDQNALVLNKKIAQDEKLRVGDQLNVKFGEGREMTWEIVGLIVDLNNQGRTAFVSRDVLASQLRIPNQGGTVWVKTERHDAAYQASIEKQLRAALEANSIRSSYSLTSARNIEMNVTQFNLITNLLLVMSVLAGVVGSLGLMGTMSINVLERSKEIGVMRAIGARSSAVVGIFVVEGVILGLLSAAIAIPLSYPGAQLFSDTLGNALFYAPLDFRYSTPGLLAWLGVIVALSALASLWPALRAARLSVRETLAYE